MELKEYQKKTLEQVKRYLEALAEFKASTPKYFTLEAWEKCGLTSYHRKQNGIGQEVPNFYLKIPTGGGKTLLACHTIDLINKTYLKKQTDISVLGVRYSVFGFLPSTENRIP